MAFKSTTRIIAPALRSPRTISISPSTLRPSPRLPRTLQPAARRLAHTIPKPPQPTAPAADSDSSSSDKPRKLLEPHYELTFTCVPCGKRSRHTVSKQGYHKGSVLITCPSCRNRHIISDHLDIFGNRKITVEDLMREKGQLVKRGTLGEDGDVEFWEDGSVTERGGGAATTAGDSGASDDPAEVQDELDALSEEENATRSREARDPSSGAAEPTNRTSTPLSSTGSRPSLGSTDNTNSVPSTRRQIYMESHRPDASGIGPFGKPPLSGVYTQPSGPPRRNASNLFQEIRPDLVDARGPGRKISKEEMLKRARDQISAKKGFDTVRFYPVPTSDGRPHFIRTGPGNLIKEVQYSMLPDGRDYKAGQEPVGGHPAGSPSAARIRSIIERNALKRSTGSNEFVREAGKNPFANQESK
ncbi:DNL zinc finger-domain-containing protein [Hypoxylon sp. FL1284]|nr:DNL zinc finger-domain-containing protein [Hypoxylon sp. FL1284]